MKQRILLVDDEAPILRLNTIVLRGAGFEVEQATSGDEALEIYVRGEGSDFPDLVLTDVEMAGMNGPKLIEAIRSIRPNQPIILCSARQAYELVERGIELPPDIPLLSKPFSVTGLIELIKATLA